MIATPTQSISSCESPKASPAQRFASPIKKIASSCLVSSPSKLFSSPSETMVAIKSAAKMMATGKECVSPQVASPMKVAHPAPPMKPFEELVVLRDTKGDSFYKIVDSPAAASPSSKKADAIPPKIRGIFSPTRPQSPLASTSGAESAASPRSSRFSTLKKRLVFGDSESAPFSDAFEAKSASVTSKPSSDATPVVAAAAASSSAPVPVMKKRASTLSRYQSATSLAEQFRFYYRRESDAQCQQLEQFFQDNHITVPSMTSSSSYFAITEGAMGVRDAACSKTKIDAKLAFTLARSVDVVMVAHPKKQNKVYTLDMKAGTYHKDTAATAATAVVVDGAEKEEVPRVITDGQLWKLLIDEAGFLRAPTVIVGKKMFVGYNGDCLKEAFFFGNSLSSVKAKQVKPKKQKMEKNSN